MSWNEQDNKKYIGPPDSSLISLQEPYEVYYWCQKLGCSETDLRKAVAAVGHSVIKVKAYFNIN